MANSKQKVVEELEGIVIERADIIAEEIRQEMLEEHEDERFDYHPRPEEVR